MWMGIGGLDLQDHGRMGEGRDWVGGRWMIEIPMLFPHRGTPTHRGDARKTSREPVSATGSVAPSPGDELGHGPCEHLFGAGPPRERGSSSTRFGFPFGIAWTVFSRRDEGAPTLARLADNVVGGDGRRFIERKGQRPLAARQGRVTDRPA